MNNSVNIIDNNRQALIQYFNRHCNNRWDAEDLAQEVFCKILSGNVDDQHIYNKLYLYHVARNALKDYYKTKQCRLHVEVPAMDTLDQMSHQVSDNHIELFLLSERLMSCLQGMPKTRKAVMTHYLFKPNSQKQISQKFSVSVGAIEKHIALGKQQLKALALAS